MTNYENKCVFLTESGASRLFNNLACANLPVVPTDPTKVSGTLVYGDTYTVHSSTYIGGCISQDAFSDVDPGVDAVEAAVNAYEAHCKALDEQFGPSDRRTVDLAVALQTPQAEYIPTLEEKWAARQESDEPVVVDA